MNQANYVTYIVAKYLDTAIVKASTQFNNTTLPSDMISTKSYTNTSDEKIEKLTREFNIHYRACIGSLIYFFIYKSVQEFCSPQVSKVFRKPW